MKILRLILAVCIFLAVAFTGTLSAGNHDHNCIGSECPVCLVIEAGRYFFNTLMLIVFLSYTALLSFNAFLFILTPHVCAFSPVTLKVRLNS